MWPFDIELNWIGNMFTELIHLITISPLEEFLNILFFMCEDVFLQVFNQAQ